MTYKYDMENNIWRGIVRYGLALSCIVRFGMVIQWVWDGVVGTSGMVSYVLP